MCCIGEAQHYATIRHFSMELSDVEHIWIYSKIVAYRQLS